MPPEEARSSPVEPEGEPPAGIRPDLPFVSVVVTVRNEARHIQHLLDSLVIQEPPVEIVVVDSASTDTTRDIVRRYVAEYDFVHLHDHPGTRGASRNYGARVAKGQVLAFIDGDCIANPFWVRELRRQLKDADIAAGKTITIGYWAFESLGRVELYHHGTDVTFPSCNLAYWRDAFEEVSGFDTRFHTAEDIDLNYRAADAGFKIAYTNTAIVYARARDTISNFFKQAYWNGYGRKQLTLKHGSLWGSYSFGRLLSTQLSFWGSLRLMAASLGYMTALLKEGRERA